MKKKIKILLFLPLLMTQIRNQYFVELAEILKKKGHYVIVLPSEYYWPFHKKTNMVSAIPFVRDRFKRVFYPKKIVIDFSKIPEDVTHVILMRSTLCEDVDMLRFKNIASFNGKMGIFVDDYWAFFTRIRAWQERHYPLFHNFLILNNESGLIYFQKDVDPPEEELIKMKKIFSNPLWKNEEYADKGDLFWSARASFNTRNFPFKGLYIMPFGVNKEVIINLLKENIEPKFDILLDGKLKSIQYGFRRRLVDIVQQNKFRWKVFDTFKPDVNMKKYLGGGNQYYKNILRCHFIISDTGDYNISARKYFEIGALGRTPIGNQTGFEEHNLVRKNIVELNEDMSQEKIENIINLAIDQKNDYLKKAKKLSNEYIHAYDQKKIVEELIDNLS